MDKNYNDFDNLRRQWSDLNWLDSDNMRHDKRQVAKVGVAWVVKLPNQYFSKPVGWEVEIIDTPLGISERSKKLLNWLRHPPNKTYDNISVFNDRNEIIVSNSMDNIDIGRKNTHTHSLPTNQTEQRFTVPPNEYEIFKKTCCECKEKSYKNSSTDSNPDSLWPGDHHRYTLSTKNSVLDLPPDNKKISKVSKRSSYSHYSDFEQELKNHMLDTSTQSSVDDTIHSLKLGTPRNNMNRVSKISKNTNRSIEPSEIHSPRKSSQIDQYRRNLNNETINRTSSPNYDYTIDQHSLNNETNNRQSTPNHDYTNNQRNFNNETTNRISLPNQNYSDNQRNLNGETINTTSSPNYDYTINQHSLDNEANNRQSTPSQDYTNNQRSLNYETANRTSSPNYDNTNNQRNLNNETMNRTSSPNHNYTSNQRSLNNEAANRTSSPNRDYIINNQLQRTQNTDQKSLSEHINKVKNERRNSPTWKQNNQTEDTTSSRRRSTGPHIPSVDIFDDTILTRGTSLEQYRSTDRNFLHSTIRDSEFKRPTENGHRNHNRHHRRRHGSKESKEASVATIPENEVLSEREIIAPVRDTDETNL